jgi:hypothetical protein
MRREAAHDAVAPATRALWSQERHSLFTCPFPPYGQWVLAGSSGALSFPEVVRPPAEEGGRADEVWLAVESHAARRLGVFQLLDAGDVVVEERRVGERPTEPTGAPLAGVRAHTAAQTASGHDLAPVGVGCCASLRDLRRARSAGWDSHARRWRRPPGPRQRGAS